MCSFFIHVVCNGGVKQIEDVSCCRLAWLHTWLRGESEAHREPIETQVVSIILWTLHVAINVYLKWIEAKTVAATCCTL